MSAAETKKYRVTKKWPGGPEVGTVGYKTSHCEGDVYFNEGSGFWYKTEELKGFVEEVDKEPEEFWYMDKYGDVLDNTDDEYIARMVPPYLRFKTKEACEKFAKALKDTHGTLLHHSWRIEEMAEALNQRVTK